MFAGGRWNIDRISSIPHCRPSTVNVDTRSVFPIHAAAHHFGRRLFHAKQIIL